MSSQHSKTDVILIGGGIMSATLGTLLKKVAPEKEIKVFEKLDASAQESSNAWNNAGTGHSALCEMNYTKEMPDGSLDISKALKINEQFQVSKEFWSYLVKHGNLTQPESFIHTVPHMSFCIGVRNVDFLRRRVKALKENALFNEMTMTEDKNQIEQWLPLIMEGRNNNIPIAVSRDETGTDVNFGALTQKLFDFLQQNQVDVEYEHQVTDLKQRKDGTWKVKVKDLRTEETTTYISDFVFIGAGGASLPLLQKTHLPESKHIGGFPVSGLFLVCQDPDIVSQHNAKVYGKAKVGAPPMSVPHLDTRYIDGKQSLLFGPFAGFSPKFLKTGSNMDLFKSVKPNNLLTMLSAGAKEMKLTQYLISQLMLSDDERIEELREFIPNAKKEDWDVVVAGQRVQVIKDTDKGGKGTLQFGTEVICSEDGSLAALLGASPGASTAVDVMLDILQRCYQHEFPEWEAKIKEMIPSFGQKLAENPELYKEVKADMEHYLKLNQQK
ncbi:malate dehydrogenase (quinone) [Staphylococcus simulans]|uniref:malate dehydrogenase (quinone) n=1 Tax=Staphylococcus simulans TaxID=1286 RepID=UPI00399C069E